MAVFNVASTFGTSKKAGGGEGSGATYGILVDQLQIMESHLETDGNLAPGDYKMLGDMALKLYGRPGLTATQRSNIEVKIEQYKSKAKQAELTQMQDIEELGSEVKDSRNQIAMAAGNNPTAFLEAESTLQFARVQQLAEAIESLEQSGQSAASHALEYREAQIEYEDTLRAIEDMERAQSGEQVQSNYAAHLVTNNRGEIVSVKVAPRGSQNGYEEVGGVSYGGLGVFGKTRREGEEQVFNLGNTRFAAGSVVVTGADGQLTLGSKDVLTSPDVQEGYQINPETVRVQGILRSGDYGVGSKGFIYKKHADGTYTKYVNTPPEQLGLDEGSMLPIPANFESLLTNNVTETVDGSVQPDIMGAPLDTMGGINVGMGDVQYDDSATLRSLPPAGTTQATPTSRGPAQPRASSPSTFRNVASQTVDAARGFLARVFGA